MPKTHPKVGSQDCSSTEPTNLPEWIRPELLSETIRVWQPHYSQPLTNEGRFKYCKMLVT